MTGEEGTADAGPSQAAGLEPVTGILLVGGESKRFGSPKALALLGGETLAARAHRTLAEACDEVIAVGKLADGLELPFPLVDDGSPQRVPIVGVAAGVRAARHDLCVVLPVDCPLVDAAALRQLAAACTGDAAHPPAGPIPGAYRRSALPALERQITGGKLSIWRALDGLAVTVVELGEELLADADEPAALDAIRLRLGLPA